MKVLVIEDSDRLRKYVGKGLRNDGFAVDLASDGEEGLWYAENSEYDVIVLDIMMPKLDGLSLLKRFRSAGRETHVLLLTARDTVEDRVHGLEEGADDYLVKPFAMEELAARVRALARRSYARKNPEIKIGALVVDTSNREVVRDGSVIELGPREYALLEYLAMRRGEVVSRTEIEGHIYDDRVEPMSNVVNSAICVLRKKIDQRGHPSYIRTRRGLGYVLEGPAR